MNTTKIIINTILFARVFITLLLASLSTLCISQQLFSEDNDQFNLLNNNTSPAFMILGVSNTEVARPTNLKTFTTSLQSATNGFTQIPNNFSFEVKPWPKNSTLSNGNEHVSFSFGFSKDQAVVIENQAKFSLGFNIDLISAEGAVEEKINKYVNANALLSLKKNALANIQANSINLTLDKLDIDKIGWFWTLSGGISWQIDSTSFNKVRSSRSGLWTTFGYESIDFTGFSFLGVAKYFYDPNYLYFNEQNMPANIQSNQADFGIRALYKHKKFFASLEYVYKLRDEIIDGLANTDKYVANFSYDLGNNNKLTLTLGKNFDNTVTKEGNLISMFNFIKSL